MYIKNYHYCEFEQAYVLDQYDSSDCTLGWSETTVFYDPREDETYGIRIDQEGSEELLWTERGIVI